MNNIHTYKDILNILTNNFFIENKIYKKQFLKENNINFADNSFADNLFNIQTLVKAKVIKVNTDSYYRYRQDSLIKKDNISSLFDIFDINSMIYKFLQNENLIINYQIEFFNYLCNSYTRYFRLCPKNQKIMYFNRMKHHMMYVYESFDVQAKNFLGNISEVKLILNSHYEDFLLSV